MPFTHKTAIVLNLIVMILLGMLTMGTLAGVVFLMALGFTAIYNEQSYFFLAALSGVIFLFTAAPLVLTIILHIGLVRHRLAKMHHVIATVLMIYFVFLFGLLGVLMAVTYIIMLTQWSKLLKQQEAEGSFASPPPAIAPYAPQPFAPPPGVCPAGMYYFPSAKEGGMFPPPPGRS